MNPPDFSSDDPPGDVAAVEAEENGVADVERAAAIRMALLQARAHWEDEDYPRALALLTPFAGVPEVDPPLRMLEAVLALEDREKIPAALRTLESVAADGSAEWHVREMAATLASRVTEPRRRDQFTIASHLGVGGSMRAGVLAAEVRTGFALEVPFGDTWRGRAELNATPLPTMAVMLSGYRFFFGPARSWPLGSGVFSVGLTANLGVWYAEGPYWRDGGAFQMGVHGKGWLDIRTGRNIGLGFEVGSTWWPTLTMELDGFGEPFEVRFVMKAWFGTPPQMKLLPPEPPG